MCITGGWDRHKMRLVVGQMLDECWMRIGWILDMYLTGVIGVFAEG